VKQGAIVALDASASTDPENDPLTFRWSQIAGVELPLTDASTSIAQFTAPSVSETLEFRFRVEVEDGRGGISLDDVSIRVTVEDETGMEEMPPPTRGDEIGGGCGCTATEYDGPALGVGAGLPVPGGRGGVGAGAETDVDGVGGGLGADVAGGCVW
jgi:hypothetical protein